MPLYTEQKVVNPVVPASDPTPIIDTASNYSKIGVSNTLISFITGSAQTVTYYNQIVAGDDTLGNSGDVVDNTLKQYRKISKFELRVSSDLVMSTDTELNTTTVTGAANLYPVIVPQVGDLIVMTVEPGTLGVFEVSNTTRASIYSDSVWSIEYSLINYLDDTIQTEIDSFVVLGLVFDVDLINSRIGPIVTESESFRFRTKLEMQRYLTRIYYDSFWDAALDTFLVPDPDYKVYDPYLVKFWNYTLGGNFSYGGGIPAEFEDLEVGQVTTLWDAILSSSLGLLSRATPYMEQQRVIPKSNNRNLRSRYTVGIDYVIGELLSPIEDSPTYVLSSDFYNDRLSPTDMETLVLSVIQNEALDYQAISLLYADMPNWSPIESFYKIPLLLTLLMIS